MQYEPFVKAALLEDLGRAGDITTDAIFPAEMRGSVAIVAREHGIVAGTEAGLCAFRLFDPAAEIIVHRTDGMPIAPGEIIAVINGSIRALLSAERTALNIIGRLSGIASLTRRYVDAVAGTEASIVCTRKTTPGMRNLEKAAVKAGGGRNHRFGLDDAVLIKDNHIAAAGGIANAMRRVRENVGHMVKIEVEVDTPAQLDEALTERAEIILLDNMDDATLRHAVEHTAGRALLEASGNMRLDRVAAVAATGVDLISVGALTHSAQVLDIGLDFRTEHAGQMANGPIAAYS